MIWKVQYLGKGLGKYLELGLQKGDDEMLQCNKLLDDRLHIVNLDTFMVKHLMGA